MRAPAPMASPPRPPVRRTSRLGAIPTPHAPGEAPSAGREDPAWLDRRDRTPASAKKSVGFSDRDPGPGVRWPAAVEVFFLKKKYFRCLFAPPHLIAMLHILPMRVLFNSAG